jgi:hypothetical protein
MDRAGIPSIAHQALCRSEAIVYPRILARGVYSSQKVGLDRYEICKVYDASNKLLGTMNVSNYGYYSRKARLPPGADQVQLG